MQPVFDSHSFKPPLQTTLYFTALDTANFTAQKTQHVFSMKVFDGVFDQRWINIGQYLPLTKQNVSGILSLTDGPIVASQHERPFPVQPGVDASRQRIEKWFPVTFHQLIAEPLRPRKVSNRRKAVVSLCITDACLQHLPRQIFPSVKANLNRQWQPGLQSYVHQAKLVIEKIKIEMLALPCLGHQLCLFAIAVATNAERTARLHACQNAHQPGCDVLPLNHVAHELFLRFFRRTQVNQGPTMLSSHLLRAFFYALRKALHKRSEVFVKNLLTRQKPIHAFNVTDGTQVAAEKHAVESCYTTDDSVSVPFHKSLHDAPPIESANPIMRLASWGACFIWLRLCCAVFLWLMNSE